MSAQTFLTDLDRIEAELAKAKQEVQSALELIRQHQADKAGLYEELARVNTALREALVAGCDRISKESVKPLVEALKMAYHEINAIHARCGVPWWDTGKSDVTQEYFTSVVEASRSALAHAKSIGLITP